MTETSVTLSKLLAVKPEHPVPGPGDVVAYDYPKGDLPVSVSVSTDAAGRATFTVTADAAETQYSMEAARRALIRSTGNDPDNPESLARARQSFGPMAFADNVIFLTKQRLLSIAFMRTGILPFLTPKFPKGDGPHENKDFTFTALVQLRPRGEVSGFEPVEMPFPPKQEVTDEKVDEFINQMMGGMLSMANVPEEAKAGMGRLRDQAREACERQRDNEHWGEVMEAVAAEFTKRLLAKPGERYVLQLAEMMANQLAEQVERSGTRWADFIKDPEFSMDDFKANMMATAEMSLARGRALDALAAHEGVTLTEADVIECLGAVARGHEAEAARAMIDNGQLPQVVEVALRAKSTDLIARKAVDTTPAAE